MRYITHLEQCCLQQHLIQPLDRIETNKSNVESLELHREILSMKPLKAINDPNYYSMSR